MNIHIGRSGKNIGEYEFEYVREGLKRGLFLESDYGWFPGMENWKALTIVIRDLADMMNAKPKKQARIPKSNTWMAEKPTSKQIKFLKNRDISYPVNSNRGQVSAIIASLPEPLQRLSVREIKDLRAGGCEPSKMTLLACHVMLNQLNNNRA